MDLGSLTEGTLRKVVDLTALPVSDVQPGTLALASERPAVVSGQSSLAFGRNFSASLSGTAAADAVDSTLASP